jgi:hypothetical protein
MLFDDAPRHVGNRECPRVIAIAFGIDREINH